ncbi:DMT family transporter [Alisedimentitalea sp. MJ-SS2]|uniref:DMT family transporter n=1 Tax=Aliisedimentitalea sp. MJ-SS2 TaxID=3049795 RepID=UPI00290BE58D|nr:DMT family transporter [Alisedimentitalea sp. MJ-SS2]MDU8927413.1 DMT family transporter [Alisedimentitalea sp. MJ-SS2]
MAAALYMLGGMFVLGFVDNFVGPMSEHIGVWQFLFLRMALSAPLLVLASMMGAGHLRAHSWPKVIARGGLLATGMVFYFGALAYVSLGEALAGLFTAPMFILLISVTFLGQRIGIWRVLAVGVGFAGVLMVLQPGGDGFKWMMILPVIGAVFYAVGNIVTRMWCADESTLVMLAATFGMQALIGLVAMVVIAVVGIEAGVGADGFLARGWIWPPNPEIWPYLGAQVLGSLIGVFCLIRAYQIGEASYVTVFEYSIMVFGPCFAFVIYGHSLGWLQLVGIGMIVLAGSIIALRSR